MYINKENKKKIIKIYKIFNLDIHGKLLKKKKLHKTFYQVYANVLENLLFLNIKKKQDSLDFLKFKNFKDYLYLQTNKITPGKLRFLISKKETNNELLQKLAFIFDLKNEKKYLITKEKEFLIFENRLKNKIKLNEKVYFLNKFASRKIFFHLYLSVTKKQYLNYLKKAGFNKQEVVNSFFNIIELRLDMLIYRSFSNLSLEKIKQLILHKKIYLNNNKISYCSFVAKKSDIISFMNFVSFENYNVFANMYIYMLSQRLNLDLFCFLFKYPKYILVDFNFLCIKIVDNHFNSKEIPNFFEYDLKQFIKIVF